MQRLPAAKRRELLLDAAAELFATRGYHGTDVASVAAATGVTKVIVYRAFGSKQAIYEAVLDHHRDGLLGALIASQQTEESDPVVRIRVGLAAWFAYVESHPHAWRLLFRDTTGLPDLEARHQAMRGHAREVITRLLIDRFGVDKRRARPTAEFLRAAIVGLALWWLENPQVSRRDILDTAESLTIGALSGLAAT